MYQEKKSSNTPSWRATVRNKPTTREQRTACGWLERVSKTWIARRKRERMVHSSCMCICVRGERGQNLERIVLSSQFTKHCRVYARWKRGNWSTGRSLSSRLWSVPRLKLKCSVAVNGIHLHNTYIYILELYYV